MIWLRKSVVVVLSLLLFISLLSTAYSTSANLTVGQPEKIKTYLAESNVYDHFVAYVADQAAKSEGADQSGSVSLNDAAVRAAAKSSFPSSLIEKNVDTFIDANYAWLEGKTATPVFKIDLTAQKETFAQRVGRLVKAYTATLPVCTTAQAIKERNVDPLAATCRPKDLTPEQAGAQVTERLSTTGDFLSDPVITSSSINPNGNKKSEPYYEKLSQLPKSYQFGQKVPYIMGALSLLCAIGIFFISLSRRKGLRNIGMVLTLTGIVLVISKLAADFAVDQLEKNVFNSSSVGELQKSLTNFAQRVESSMVRTELIFGVVFIILGMIILVSLIATRRKGPKKIKDIPVDTDGAPESHMPLLKARKRLMRPFGDSIMPLGARPGGAEPEAPVAPTESEEPSQEQEPAEQAETTSGDNSSSDQPIANKPRKRKRPRLIQ